MSDKYITPRGEKIDLSRLSVPKAHELANALFNRKIEFAELIECRTDKGEDIVVFNVGVEVPQIRKYPINSHERIAAIFSEKDNKFPEVLALRSDFPKIPHLYLRDVEFPRSLCLYEGEYRDIRDQWTALRFVERIRKWLADSARGELHQEDQALEPLLLGAAGKILIPYSLLKNKNNISKILYIYSPIFNERNRNFYIAKFDRSSTGDRVKIISTVHWCLPRKHGIMHWSPKNLAEVAQFVNDAELDIINELSQCLIKEHSMNNPKEKSLLLECQLMIIIICPKTRHGEQEPESMDIWPFITTDTVKEVGEKLEIWEQHKEYVGKKMKEHIGIIIDHNKKKDGSDIKIYLLNPSFYLTRERAAILSGLNETIELKITAIGVGALGSQVIMNLARSGVGTWNLIDRDILESHNVTRHFLTTEFVGCEKSFAIANIGNNIIQGENLFNSIPADVLEPGKYEGEVDTALKNADVILDVSVSVATARYLTLDVESTARRISIFLNPTGRELVLLAEDTKRLFKLDELEMQLYKAIINNKNLSEHYKPSNGYQRYGRSCRDITTILSQNSIALHAAIGAQALQEIFQSNNAQVTIWKSDSYGNVKRIDISTTTSIRYKVNNWTVVILKDMLNKLFKLRNKKLPNETGGILIGYFDHTRHIVYIVETIPSPPDSKEWPTVYIRGCEGLKQEVKKILLKTNRGLNYIGEWHSHPDRVSTKPSKDDFLVFKWLTEFMDKDGLPTVMIIIGRNNHASCFINEIKSKENLIPI